MSEIGTRRFYFSNREKNPSVALLGYVLLARTYVLLNLRSQWEYRGAFIWQVVAMMINNSVWVVFWTLFFSRFPVLKGWQVTDVLTIWGISASGFGIAHALFGNAWYLPALIMRGQLDAWLLYPRALLPHLILGRTVTTAWGDAIFGYAVYIVFLRPDPLHFCFFVILSLSVALLFVGFSILSGAIAFWIGNAETVAEQWRFSLVTFSTYPSSLFHGAMRLLLFTLIPAGFASYLPIRALKNLSFVDVAWSVLGSIAVFSVGCIFFYVGLRRYESGSLLEMRG